MKRMYNITNGTWHLEVSVEELAILITATKNEREKIMEIFGRTEDTEIKKWLERKIIRADKMLETMDGQTTRTHWKTN